jgi:F0F1-type ATP synthase delta subunit
MPKHSSMNAYLTWTKERIDEMDATLASFEAKADQIRADSRAKADQLMADMKNQRDAFQATLTNLANASGSARERMKAQLSSQWKKFEAQVQTYIDTVGKQIELQQVTFRNVADAQLKAWHEAANKFRDTAAKLTTERRARIDAAIKITQANASEAEARLQKLRQAGNESWAALSEALGESRKAFDRANRTAWDAIKRASS